MRPSRPALPAAPGAATLAQPAVAASMLDALTEVVFHADSQGRWTFLNPAWQALTGARVATVLGASCLAHVHPEDLPHEQAMLDQLLSGARACCRHEVRYLHAGGGLRWAEVFARASHGADGGVSGIVGTLLDISERKAAQQQRRLAASMFASAGEGIIVTSPAGQIVDVNNAFESITGYARADVLGKNPRLLSSGRQGKSFYARMWHCLQATGSWSGEVWNRRKSGECYAERLTITAVHDDDGTLSHHVGVFADITGQKREAERLEHIAHYDPLTGLPNRRLLTERLRQAMARPRSNGAGVAVACLDIDGFKAVNERHGRTRGDQLLVALAHRLQEQVREGDTACRIDGDEFVVLFDGVESPQACQHLIARLLQALAEPVEVDGRMLRVSASAGIALRLDGEELDADQLIRQADQAMYQAKIEGKNRYSLFDSLGYRVMLDRIHEIEAVEAALARGEFVLYYQPIVHLRSGELNSVEALIRWNHPERGCLAPGGFLPALEGHPLMLELENWVLEEAFRQHERWLGDGLDVAISVNLSSAQLRRKDFVGHVRTLLARYPRTDPRRIKLEVLESSALEDMDHVSGLIAQCAELGIAFALDDFGTGYSSLRYLKQLPAKRIKIDQSFVRDMTHDPDDLAILEGIMGMAAAFKREVVAEGVESAEHAAMLVQLGCMLAQGYGIARPMPAAALDAWRRAWRLPAAVTARAPLERDDMPLLRALVEHRAGPARLSAAPGGVQAFEEWLALDGVRRRRCKRQVACALDARDALLAHGAQAGQASLAFIAALEALLDA